MEKEYTQKNIYCNACGRQIRKDNDILKEDVLKVTKDWGYFSKKDLQIHEFVLCEECYDKMIDGFVRPVEISEKKEAMS